MQVLQKGVEYALEEVQLGVEVLIKGASCDPCSPHNLGDVGLVETLMGKLRLGVFNQPLPSEIPGLGSHLSVTHWPPTDRLVLTLEFCALNMSRQFSGM